MEMVCMELLSWRTTLLSFWATRLKLCLRCRQLQSLVERLLYVTYQVDDVLHAFLQADDAQVDRLEQSLVVPKCCNGPIILRLVGVTSI